MEQLVKKIFIEGEIKLLTGTHIGGTNSAMGIGGPDSTVVRNPIDNKPYIPGSSIKGKIRSLVEVADGTIGSANMRDIKNVASDDPNSASGKLFGTATNDLNQRPSKIIVRDAEMLSDDKEFINTDLPYTESKTEVVIDRITAKANPRQIERVPAGARFKLNMVLNVFDVDDMNKQLSTLFRGIKLLENDYLGGNGSRGYGQVKFNIEKVISKNVQNLIDEDYKGEDITETWKSKLS